MISHALPRRPGKNPTSAFYFDLAKRTDQYMRLHLDEPQTMETICEGVRCRPGTLNKAFNVVFRTSPMAYFRILRLNAVRVKLASGAAERITDVAADYGFWHLGHFGAMYKTIFGETPSETKKRLQ